MDGQSAPNGSTPTNTKSDATDLWNAGGAVDLAFWQSYLENRAIYSSGFYEEIFQYHAAHSSSWGVAHDVACGPGQVIPHLIKRFNHVVASDINAAPLAAASWQTQKEGIRADRVTFTNCPGEEVYRHHEAGSADLVIIAEAIPLMDEVAALRSSSILLRTGGTLAAEFYGRPTFSNPALRESGQKYIDELMKINWGKEMVGIGPAQMATFKRSAGGMGSWLDYLSFDPTIWCDVQRIKWNSSAKLSFFEELADVCGFEAINNVRAGELCQQREDPTWWQRDLNIKGIRQLFEVLAPAFKRSMVGDAVVADLFAQLAKVMGGEQVEQSFTWPTALVLATRR